MHENKVLSIITNHGPIAGFLGKSVTGQIDWLLTIPIVLTVVPAAFLGGLVSRLVSVLYLRRLLALLIGVAAFRMWIFLFN